MGTPAASHGEAPATPFLGMQFPDLEAQQSTGKLGVWLFLGSEILFFSGLFVAYGVYRANHHDLFAYGHHFLDWRMGALNTLVLIGSSLSAAWAVRSAQLGDRKTLLLNLFITLALAGAFLVVKYFEYSHKLHNGVGWGTACHPSPHILASLPAGVRDLPVPPRLGTFFGIYYAMTGLHGIHVLVGIGLFVWLIRRALRGDFKAGYYLPVDGVALYWHLVDLIWIFLFPLFYLV